MSESSLVDGTSLFCFKGRKHLLLHMGSGILDMVLELPSASVELVKVDLEGKGFSCFEAVIGGNGVQISCRTQSD